MLLRPDQMRTSTIPGSEAMMAAYQKVTGYDPQKSMEEKARKSYSEWLKNNPGGTQEDFFDYQNKLAAWTLHQGPGGKSYQEKISKAFGGGQNVPPPKRAGDINLFSSGSRERMQ